MRTPATLKHEQRRVGLHQEQLRRYDPVPRNRVLRPHIDANHVAAKQGVAKATLNLG